MAQANRSKAKVGFSTCWVSFNNGVNFIVSKGGRDVTITGLPAQRLERAPRWTEPVLSQQVLAIAISGGTRLFLENSQRIV